jgi:hypothetical protein
MTQEEKQLLLTDLCARLPYGVKGIVAHYDEDTNERIDVVGEIKAITRHQKVEFFYSDGTFNRFPIEDFKPYLRPMSSMIEEEREEFDQTMIPLDYYDGYTIDTFDWLNAHHFDIRGLIEKGLALEAPEGMFEK